MYLLIDYREQDFIKKISETSGVLENDIIRDVTINNIHIKYKVTNLAVGDFIILEDIDDNNTIQVIIERKSIQDLCSSITDGRFREQKQRLIESINDTSKICYLIEGTNKDSFSLSYNIINGSLLNLIFKHKYKLIQTSNILDTYNTIILLYKKFKNNDFETNGNVSTGTKLIKRSEKVKNNKLLNQLCLIPGVSSRIAETIMTSSSSISSISSLIQIYNDLNEQPDGLFKCEAYFADIPISGSSNQRSRKIGPSISKKIYEYFCKE